MVANFFRYLIFGITLAAISTTLYLNVIVIPEGHAGVLTEKTQGPQFPAMKPGYHWLWSGFVPGKWTLRTVDMKPPSLEVRYSEPLKYAQLLPDRDYFTIHTGIRVNYELTDRSLEFFWQYLDANPETIHRYLQERVRIMLQMALLKYYQSAQDLSSLAEKLRLTFFEGGEFEKQWSDIFNKAGIVLQNVEVLEIKAPDREIYLSQISDQNRILAARREALILNIRAEAETDRKRLMDQAELEKAEKMAALMEQYPDLLEYYRIEKLYPHAAVTIVDQPAPVFFENAPSSSAQARPQAKTQPKKQSEKGTIPPITRP